jgi:hypothetical protein
MSAAIAMIHKLSEEALSGDLVFKTTSIRFA